MNSKIPNMVDRVVIGNRLLDDMGILDKNDDPVTEAAFMAMTPELRQNFLRAVSNVYGVPAGILPEEKIQDIIAASKKKKFNR